MVAAKLLISHGANINGKDINGKTPLHRAVIYERNWIIALLLSNGANINEKDNGGKTALQYAEERKMDLAMIKIHYPSFM